MAKPSSAEKGLNALLNELIKQKHEYEKTVAKCGIIGRSRTGKSSLINAITGQKLARTGPAVETTLEPTEYPHGGLSLWDLPGCGMQRFPTSDYVRKFGLDAYDFFIFVTADGFYADDGQVLSDLLARRKPCFIVRNKFDQVLENAKHDDVPCDEVWLRDQVTEDIRKQLHPASVGRVYLVSARKPASYDLPELLFDIQNSFTGLKRLRIENDLAAWSEAALEKKRANAMTIVSWYAGLAAANGLNPVPGLDVSVDVALLRQLAIEVSVIYGLSEEQKNFWEGLVKGPHGQAVMQRVVALTAKYGAEQAVVQVLKAIGKREVPKTVAKYIPFIGQVLAAGAGYALTYNFGSSLVDEYHEMATALLHEVQSNAVEA